MLGRKHSKIFKSIAKDPQIPKHEQSTNTQTEIWKTTKLLGSTKYNEVKLVFAFFDVLLFVPS